MSKDYNKIKHLFPKRMSHLLLNVRKEENPSMKTKLTSFIGFSDESPNEGEGDSFSVNI